MKIHELTQGSDEWAAFRLTHHGASEAAAMLGLSKKTIRSELLRIKHTGMPKEFSDWVQKNILDYGHEVEAMARPIIEGLIGEDLYPVTCSNEDEGGILSASCDGLTMGYDTAFEHKQWNAELAASIADGVLPEEYMPQCQQIMLVTGAKRVIFTVSDGTPENLVWMEVHPDADWFERVRAGWTQFDRDLADYVPPEVKPEAIGRAPDALPALRIELTGQVTASNLAEFRAQAQEVLNGIKADGLLTDEDFANADKTAKWCSGVESRIDAAKQDALAKTASIDELFRTLDAIKEDTRQVRLSLEKTVKAKKDALKLERISKAKSDFAAHVAALQSEIADVRLTVLTPDFGGAIKGLKTLTSVDNAIGVAMANAKIYADQQAADVREKLGWLGENAAEHRALLADLQQLIAKPLDDFKLMVTTRIDAHRRAEEARLEAERERIRNEEAAKLAAQAESIKPPTSVADLAVSLGAALVGGSHYVPSAHANDGFTQPMQGVAGVVHASAATPHCFDDAIDSPPALKLGEINARLGFTLSADFLAQLGFVAYQGRSARLYHERDWPGICASLVRHIQSKARVA